MAVVTIIYRIQGKDIVDLQYAATDKDLRGCKLLQIAMLALQLHLDQVRTAPSNLHIVSDMKAAAHMSRKGCLVCKDMSCIQPLFQGMGMVLHMYSACLLYTLFLYIA